MAWPSKTWVDGEIPDKGDLNGVGDQLNDLDQHAHTGADGDGSENINPDTVTLDDISEPDAPGANKVLVYSASEVAKVRAGAAGSSINISLATHTHTQGSEAETKAESGKITLSSTSYTNTTTATQTPQDSTGSPQYAITQHGSSGWRNTTGSSGTGHMRLLKDSVQQVEVSATVPTPANDMVMIHTSFVHIALANASTDFEVEIKKSGTHAEVVVVIGSLVREIQCL